MSSSHPPCPYAPSEFPFPFLAYFLSRPNYGHFRCVLGDFGRQPDGKSSALRVAQGAIVHFHCTWMARMQRESLVRCSGEIFRGHHTTFASYICNRNKSWAPVGISLQDPSPASARTVALKNSTNCKMLGHFVCLLSQCILKAEQRHCIH
jgi:hypothetical protein